MAKTRTIKAALAKAFEQSGSIAYFVNESQVITFANQACADWVGIEVESLVGTKTIYSTELLGDAAEEKAKGLAVEPRRFQVQEIQGNDPSEVIARIFATSDGKHDSKQAIVNRIHDSDENLLGFLIIESPGTSNVPDDLPAIDSAFNSAALHQTLAKIRAANQSRYKLKNLIGNSADMKRVVRQAHSAARCDCDLIVVGPPGSGREHLAKSIFNERDLVLGNEDQSNLFPIHCAITDPVQIQRTMKELVDDRKQRTPATSDTENEVVDTLLLIDVDQLSEGSQHELLGFLELPAFPFRAIATSEFDLTKPQEIRGETRGDESGSGEPGLTKTFSTALAARLCTMVIELPPLKQRREDLPLLAQSILEQKNELRSEQLSKFSKQAMELVCEFDWPKNFDQLVTMIDAAAEHAQKSQIEVDDFPVTFRQAVEAQRVGQAKDVRINLVEYLERIEVELIKRALAHAKGNKTKASQMLAISRPKLLRRLDHFGLMDNQNEDGPMLDASVFKEADE